MVVADFEHRVPRGERRAHERQVALTGTLVEATKTLGREAVYGVRHSVEVVMGFETRLQPTVALDVLQGIEDPAERDLFEALVKAQRRLGEDGVARAYSGYITTVDQLAELEAGGPIAPEREEDFAA